jgi:hypothetical protein
MPQKYEVRGLKFLSTSNNMAMSHACTFVISLRLPSGSYWVTHCLFMDDSAYSDHMRAGDKESVVAKGAGVVPSHLFSDAIWPKEVLQPATKDALRSKAKLKYIRKRGEKKVLVKIDVWAKNFQTLQFNLLEENAASSDETIEMDGKVRAGFEGRWGEKEQSLERQPWGVAYDYRFAPS